MDVEKFLRLKKQLNQLKEQVSRLQGGREILLERLQKEFNCSSVGEGKKLLQEIEQDLEEKNKSYTELCTSFEKDFYEQT